MSYRITVAGTSRSFAEGHAFIESASDTGDARIYLGDESGHAFAVDQKEGLRTTDVAFVAIELGQECLALHTGEPTQAELDDNARSNIFGFARFRLGDADPSNLIELVKPSLPDPAALAKAKAVFEEAGFVVAVCGDFPGRIVDRLVRPYYNAALRRLDERLATASDLDTTLKLGLGYPEGPIALLERTGLHHHFAVTQALYEALGDAAYVPARRAQVAYRRSRREEQ
jgi:3-hydroxybutyryl-CoA dehydrogenase